MAEVKFNILIFMIFALWLQSKVDCVEVECSSKKMVVMTNDDEKKYMIFSSKPNKTASQCMFHHSRSSKRSIVLTLPFTKCKTYVSSSNLTSTVFTNKVWEVFHHNSSIEFQLVAEFSCSYPPQYQVLSTMKKMKTKRESRKTMDDPILCLNPFDCPKQSCQNNRAKNQVVFTNRETINLILRKKQLTATKSEQSPEQIASLDAFFITCNPSSPSRRFRMDSYSNGCSLRNNGGSTVYSSADYNSMADTICISFPLFEFKRSLECTELQITALVRNCSEDSREDCPPWIGGVHCPANTASNSISQVSIGPIYLLPHVDSKSAIIHYKTNTDEMTTLPNDVTSVSPTTPESTTMAATIQQILTTTAPTVEMTKNNLTLTADRNLTDQQQFTKEPEPDQLDKDGEALKPTLVDMSAKRDQVYLEVRRNDTEFDVFDEDNAEEPVLFIQDTRTFGGGSFLENIVDERYLGEYNDHYDQLNDQYIDDYDQYDQYIENYYDDDDDDNDDVVEDIYSYDGNEKTYRQPITAVTPISSQRKMTHERYFKWTLIVLLSSLVVASVAVGFTLYICRRN